MTETPNENNTVVLGGAAQPSYALPIPVSSHGNEVQNALPIGTRMGEFEIIGLVGEGGFGIVYLAQDHSLERKVALKEYMPASLASRGLNASVTVRSERLQETFEIGRRSFVNEARLLAQFDHPSLVKVYRFWEANATAYMAMPYYDGITLRDSLQRNPQYPDEAWLKKLLDPVTEALATIHAHNCFHRDIAPDNIMLLRDGRPVLLDFGAARRVIGDMTQALTVILKPGYAPIEQYAEMPNMRQGAWTDIYALAAVVYYAVSKRLPPPSVSRIMQDTYIPLAETAKGRYSDAFLRGVDQCLIVRPEQRPQTIAEMRELLGIFDQGTTTAATQILISLPEVDTAPPQTAAPAAHRSAPPAANSHTSAKSGRLIGAGIAALVVCAGLGGGAWYFLANHSASGQPEVSNAPTGPMANTPSTPLVPPPVTAQQIQTKSASQTANVAPPLVTQSMPETRLEPVATDKTDSVAANATRKTKTAHPGGSSSTRRAEGTDNSERDYVHKLNKDLDEMLR